ncbi:FecCD family ABC transporter permease [Glycomyces salinus]|uniref:FecCD family ABC transporter permease n=1 Tax=Glycomyces salinus TaxID=980294 RepID=UPI0027D9DBF8|nr:iron ABC transporter permease [Glycomyces salinus]
MPSPVPTLRPSATARGRRLTTSSAVAALALVVLASLAVGARDLSPLEVWDALIYRSDPIATAVVWDQRVPRSIVGILAGAGLAVAGVLMQTVTRNPLADPRIFGVASGASLGVVIGLSVFDMTRLEQYVWFGITGALAAGILGYAISTAASRGDSSPVTFAITGAALDASLSAAVYAVLTTDVQSFDQYRFWAVGSLAARDESAAAAMLPFLLAGLAVAFLIARGLDGLLLGSEAATGLGHRVGLTRAVAALTVALLVGAAVAAAGPIGFVGLAIPHLARWAVGGDHRPMIVLSVVLGPVLLLGADVIGRVIVPGEAPAGIVCAIIGAPLLIALVRRARMVTA